MRWDERNDKALIIVCVIVAMAFLVLAALKAHGRISGVVLYRMAPQTNAVIVFMSENGSGTACTAVAPCSQAYVATLAGVTVYALDGVYAGLGPITNAANPALCTDVSCANVYRWVLP